MIFPKNQILKLPMRLSFTVGIWRIILIENQRLKKLYRIISSVFYYYYFEYVLRSYYQLYLLLREDQLNIEEILRNICVTLLYTVPILRLKAFNSQKIQELFVNIIETESGIMKDPDLKIKTIYLANVKKINVCTILFLFNTWIVFLFYFLPPLFMDWPTLVNGNDTVEIKSLPFSTWWPIDVQKYYWFAYGWSVFDGILCTAIVTNSDILTFSLIIFALSQLKILSYRLRQFDNENMVAEEEYFKRKFIGLIKEHQKIIAYIDSFNEAMKFVMLFDFLQCSVQLATITLQLLVMEINVQNIIFVGEFMFTMLIRLAIYYFNANEVIYQSQNLAIDVWQTDWYEQSEDVKKIMLFFIARAQRPLKFLIGPFGSMSLVTFISILKATYSYIMLFINTSK